MIGRIGLMVVGVLVAVMAVPPPASALLVWSLTPLQVVATAGQQTTITFTATNLDPRDLGCVEIELPDSYTFAGVNVGQASNGREWDWYILDRFVHVHSIDGGGRLEVGDSVTFGVTLVPTAGIATWSNHAHRSQNCDDANEIGVPITATILPPILATPKPTPKPTPRPTPQPTPRPTPAPTPVVLLPTVPALPTLPPLQPGTPRTGPSAAPSRPSPSELAPTATQRATATPSPTAASSVSQTPSPGVAAPAPTPPRAGPGAAAVLAPRVVADEASMEVGFGEIDVLAGAEVWAVPAATIGVPGLLILIWVALQAVGALAWIPAVRRLRGEDERLS